ncbi:LacI family DNA-binding transcriptional regulator [Enterobacter sp.]|uniref:LacI family DNA-binding transcriptional regulator n=1 Tax=Enterobacter sp. TaxID=42895 RepID=UPI00297004F9|nr:LacI family DNA-binding transcriptional regulator [Enterobacter sp.]
MKNNKKITTKSLAQTLGISHTTVSNAWNNPEKLSARLRERILRYADEVGFKGPDTLARALRTGKSDTIGVIFNDSMSYVFIDPHDINLMRGIATRCEKQHINLVLIPLQQRQHAGIAPLTTLVDGYILNATHNNDAIILQTLARRLPVVTLDFRLPQYSSLSIDNARAMQDMARYLLGKGHQHVGIIAFPASTGSLGMRDLSAPVTGDNALMVTRVNACRDTLLAHHIAPEQCWLYETRHDEEHGAEAAHALLAAHPEITALICLSDRFAIGAMQHCQRRNIAVPQQVAITGFDDLAVESGGPALTTIAQDAVKKGEIAVELLLNNGPVTHYELEHRLIIRESA